MPNARRTVSVRAIALFEAGKGMVALLAAMGLAFHHQTASLLEDLPEHLHLNPARTHPNAFLHALQTHASTHAWLIALGALLYAALRWTEAVGLWLDRRWAEWVGASTAAFYLPFELLELHRHPTILSAILVLFTAAVVVVLTARLRARATSTAPPSPAALGSDRAIPG